MKPVSLFGNSIKSVSPFISAQRRLNVFYDVHSDGDKSNLTIRNTPGLTLFITLPTYPVRGWIEAGDYLYIVAGQSVYQACQNGGYTLIGNLSSSDDTSPVGMAINETQVMIVDGTYGYIFNYLVINTPDLIPISTIMTNTSVLNTLCFQTGNS